MCLGIRDMADTWGENTKGTGGVLQAPQTQHLALFVTVCVLVAQSCPTPCDPKDCSPPDSSVHGILQARILEWVAIPSPGDLPDPGIEPRSPALQADSLLSEQPTLFLENILSNFVPLLP